MKKSVRTLILLLAAVTAVPSALYAQDPYDDLYYSPSKAKEKEKKEKERIKALRASTLPAADSYNVSSDKPLEMDVDTYNRRNSKPATGPYDGKYNDSFKYTRRIELFHDSTIVSASGDTTLIDYYYNTPSQQDVNIYVINNIAPYDYYTWGATPWSFYNPWRYSYWAPGWSFNFGYNPWFDISWGNPWWGPSWGWGGPGWGWGPGWGPSWGWGPGWGWGGPAWGAPLPPPSHGGGWASNSSGAARPHRPSSGASVGRNPGYTGGASSSRPGNMGRPSYGSSISRPGNSGLSRPSRPASGNNNNYRGTNNSRRGSYSGSNNSGSYNNSSGSNRNTSPSYRNTTPSYRNSGGSSWGGSNNSSRGGGGSVGGGGASRGRR